MESEGGGPPVSLFFVVVCSLHSTAVLSSVPGFFGEGDERREGEKRRGRWDTPLVGRHSCPPGGSTPASRGETGGSHGVLLAAGVGEARGRTTPLAGGRTSRMPSGERRRRFREDGGRTVSLLVYWTPQRVRRGTPLPVAGVLPARAFTSPSR